MSGRDRNSKDNRSVICHAVTYLYVSVARFCKWPPIRLIHYSNWQLKLPSPSNRSEVWIGMAIKKMVLADRNVRSEDSCEDGSREIPTEASSMSRLPEIIVMPVEKIWYPTKFNMYRVLLTDTWIYVFNLYINILCQFDIQYTYLYFYWHIICLIYSLAYVWTYTETEAKRYDWHSIVADIGMLQAMARGCHWEQLFPVESHLA